MQTALFQYVNDKGEPTGLPFNLVWLASQTKEQFIAEFNEVSTQKIKAL